MLDKEAAILIETRAVTHKMTYLQRGIDTRLSKAACEQGHRGRVWLLERVLQVRGALIEAPFFADECPVNRLTLAPDQQAHAGL